MQLLSNVGFMIKHSPHGEIIHNKFKEMSHPIRPLLKGILEQRGGYTKKNKHIRKSNKTRNKNIKHIVQHK